MSVASVNDGRPAGQELVLSVKADGDIRNIELVSCAGDKQAETHNAYPFSYICRLGSDYQIQNLTLSLSRLSERSPLRGSGGGGPSAANGQVPFYATIFSEHENDPPILSFRYPRQAVATITKESKTGGQYYFEYAEHCFLGDEISLQYPNHNSFKALYKKLDLGNGLHLTYGQISALSGDFYGTTTPISDGSTPEIKVDRFLKAFKSLAGPGSGRNKQPDEALKILKLLQAEVDALTAAHKNHQDTAWVYDKLPKIDNALQAATQLRGWDYPSYGMLAFKNWDHFGEDARASYNAGHTAALQYAVGSDSKLEYAYAMNAFADHFLQDSFSAGHLRTPRRGLHGTIPIVWDDADWCSKKMHDEDCAIGLNVTNKHGSKSWRAYGDKQLLQDANRDNLEQCSKAVQQSANEVWTAWSEKKMPAEFLAWDYAPTLESARGKQELAPLFLDKFQSRLHIEKRAEHKWTGGRSYKAILHECEKSGLWNYPIKMTQ
ncbi:hypothetical protein CDD81_4113 [Ophiocordyceps australis]|uniref:Phosphatidylcholine-hydrolyzing phospholipase C n=1 Tax=Ophiocordyceps australis TaxID=1399860 RepID=A0A2C5YBP2_9HYPO|nr:hypothetical protein CDD81_4113 [Ophiocordyceps australis]